MVTRGSVAPSPSPRSTRALHPRSSCPWASGSRRSFSRTSPRPPRRRTTSGPATGRTRRASGCGDPEAEGEVDPPGGIPADDARSEDLGLLATLANVFQSLLLRILDEAPLRDRVEVHDPSIPYGGRCGREERRPALREVHD